jgi:hypothetical protein
MIGLTLRFSKCRPPIFADVLMFRHQKILPGRWGATTPSRHRGGKILTRKPEVKSNGLFPIFASIGCWLSSSIGTFERDLYLISLSLVYRKLARQ